MELDHNRRAGANNRIRRRQDSRGIGMLMLRRVYARYWNGRTDIAGNYHEVRRGFQKAYASETLLHPPQPIWLFRDSASLTSLSLCVVLFLSTLYPAYSNPTPGPHFHTEQAAQRHCPNDTVVWVNTETGIYHLKGERWYGATKQGAYVCRREADAEGDRLTRNGQ